MAREAVSETGLDGALNEVAAGMDLRQPQLRREAERMRRALSERRRADWMRAGAGANGNGAAGRGNGAA